ncbi:hypothetical protein [Kutzneria sp. NPDC051319]|uniref:hypothetical protein n=1 Tax=Kutzneria sp. NPDC051319 TaxID=3155047 RepID=UPI0034356D10
MLGLRQQRLPIEVLADTVPAETREQLFGGLAASRLLAMEDRVDAWEYGAAALRRGMADPRPPTMTAIDAADNPRHSRKFGHISPGVIEERMQIG